MKYRIVFLAALLPLTRAAAQKPCSLSNFCGKWKLCGSVPANDYDHPPAAVNADSLVQALYPYDPSGTTWGFGTDGIHKRTNRHNGGIKGRFRLVESNCDLELSSRKKHPMRIVHLDDSSMIIWHDTPKAAFLTLYRR